MPKYHIDRSITVSVPPQQAYELLADYHSWSTWSPWLISDPQAQVTISDNATSIGSRYAWEGEITGQGELEHLQLTPNRSIADELRFIKPFKAICKTNFFFEPSGSGTKIRWTMDGSMPWFLFFLVPMIRTMVGLDYQRGLTMIKDLLETNAIPSKVNIHGKSDVGPVRMAGIVGFSPMEGIGKALADTMKQTDEAFRQSGMSIDKPMVTVYTKFRMKDAGLHFIAGYLLGDNEQIPASSPLKLWSLPACKAFRVEHIGAYRHLGNAWSVANQWVQCKKMKQLRVGTFEIYRNTPDQVPEEDLRTDIYLPLK
ncbi:Polyketide cyclase / dehydrase and lipid transport [Pirellula sp. SH-Sr6A]|uniref:SRPBCC family protein n=1 Tax=Pirellula sp. SH-Sr6A TaxID=1632865 RepID=UPI00078CD4D2|nr:SRPBCC family protein [Pirellula sp. SH-Sr6A]AMV31893.1 Polyketide cyclase / dehydrase and lipid transport [Pirellula sp. SH-Sr6A]